jgi:two-component system, OmpR family, alkaline phosphatase synthesis response regulator PhoP
MELQESIIKKKKLLIVDDEPDIIEFLSYNFRKRGFDVYSAADGLEGIKAVRSLHPDIIIADIMMPRMSGIVMCRQLKSNDEHCSIPLIFLSATNDDYQVLSAMDAGADHYISKPVRVSMLAQMVEELISDKGSAGLLK